MRLLQIIVVLFGISFITFGLTYMSPGDPVRNMYSANGVMPTEEMVEQTREEMGLNDPFFVQYGRWLGNCLQGDFGKSYSLNKPVTELLAERLWPTLKLTLMAILLMLVLSIPLGMASALKKDTWIDYLVRGITFIGCAMPNFWVGLLLMMAFCVYFQIFPVISSAGDFKSLFLPALTLAIAMTSKYTRQVRTAGLCDRRPGERSKMVQNRLVQCIPELSASSDHHVWSVHRISAWWYGSSRSYFFLSGPWKPCSVCDHFQRL